ncbi:MAG: hypothetical protein IJD40_05350 [Lachnospiraceae bacterium]|nr:hypothetical protein [Lachnospiraceae bacterium]
MSLYETIKNNFILPDAYKDWTDYRNTITNYIIRETNQVSVPLSFGANMDETCLLPTLAIIGAGACNDIDLQVLVSHFSKITLIDYDSKAMKTALETYDLINSSHVECKAISLNGLNDSYYETFCNLLQEYVQENLDQLTPEKFEDYAISFIHKTLEQIEDYEIPLPVNTYDYICCFGVHSQFQAMFSYIYRAFEVNLREMKFSDIPEFNSRFNKRLQEENERFIPLFHDTLFKCAKQAVFLGFEQSRTNNTEAIEGAHQAMQDINKRSLPTEESYLIWPFLPSEDIYYEMSIMKIKV